MSPQMLYRSEAFAEDLPGFGGQPQAIPRAAEAPAAPKAAPGLMLWPLALAITCASLLALLTPLA